MKMFSEMSKAERRRWLKITIIDLRRGLRQEEELTASGYPIAPWHRASVEGAKNRLRQLWANRHREEFIYDPNLITTP